MGTYETVGGHAASPIDDAPAPNWLVEDILERLELRGVPEAYCDRIVAILEEYVAADRAEYEAGQHRLRDRNRP